VYTRRFAQRFIASCVVCLFGLQNISILSRPTRADDGAVASEAGRLVEALKPFAARYGFLDSATLPPSDGAELTRLAAILGDAVDRKAIDRRLDAAISRSFRTRPLVYVDGWALSEVDLDIIRVVSVEAGSGLH
jgi:hypothetical protein